MDTTCESVANGVECYLGLHNRTYVYLIENVLHVVMVIHNTHGMIGTL